MKNVKTIIIIAVIIGALLLVKHFFFPVPDEGASGKGPSNAVGKDGKPPVQTALVSVFVVKAQSLDNNLFATGTIMPNETVELRPEISGKVTAIYFKEGQAVTKGQVLLKLNDADLQAQLMKINAEIKLSEEKLGRYKQLLTAQGVSREEYDMASTEVQSLKADAEVLKVQIDRAKITAPFNGMVGLRNVSEGSYITPQIIVAVVQQLNPVKIDFSVPERYASMIKNGSKITFSIEGSDKKYEGIVYAFEPGIDAATRTLKIRARAANTGNAIVSGAFAKVELVLAKNENALMVPTQSIVPVLKGQQVYISRGGKAVAVPVQTVLRNETMVQIVSGIQAGDTIITTGIMGIRPGMPLKIMK
ncbi:MAG: efflux RND transporter periplasmic adaptor subunit [Bacteroidia bacterium]|nr:efflux RND transporter periplasmic adaptor subunit [Bacteroidia bacterium]